MKGNTEAWGGGGKMEGVGEKTTLNKSSREVDSITRLAKQAKESKKFQTQKSEAAALYQGRNTLHLISAAPTDTIYRKSITSWKRAAFIVNAFHHFGVPAFMSLLDAESWAFLWNRKTIQAPLLLSYRTFRNSVPLYINFPPFIASAVNNYYKFTLNQTVAYISLYTYTHTSMCILIYM